MGFFTRFLGGSKGPSSLDEANWEAEGGLRDQFKAAGFDDETIKKIKEACLGMSLQEITIERLVNSGDFTENSQVYRILKVIRPNSPETRELFAEIFLKAKLKELGIDEEKQESICQFYVNSSLEQRVAKLDISEEVAKQILEFINEEEKNN